jgi:putative DNA modification/repair radical SAM protein
LRRRLTVLADAAKYDASCASGGGGHAPVAGGLGRAERTGICHSYTPDGRCVSLLRVLLTNHCIYDCLYCVNRASSDIPRASFEPAEVVELTLAFYRRNYIEGLFLSSGIVRGPDATTERLVEVARSLREDHAFGGYIHLKIIPGASPELVAAAGRYADRLSANVELPTARDLDALAPEKHFADVERVMGEIHARREGALDPRAPSFAPAGQSTQMIVGATPTADAEILATAASLYQRHRLARVYYTAYSPIPRADPRLPPSASPLLREHRLYQADWLIRRYGFSVEELLDPATPDLDPELDPKLVWALRHRDRFPIDLNAARREEIVRVPGIGLKSAQRIVLARRERRLRFEDLRRLGVVVDRARPFVAVDGAPPDRRIDRVDLESSFRRPAQQLDLFAIGRAATTGDL